MNGVNRGGGRKLGPTQSASMTSKAVDEPFCFGNAIT